MRLILISLFTIQSIFCLSAHACQPAIQLFIDSLQQNKVVLVGEASHTLRGPHDFLKQLVKNAPAESVNFIALEIQANRYQELVRYIRGQTNNVPAIGIWSVNGSMRSLMELLNVIRAKNFERRKLGLRDMDLLPVDMPHPGSRDQHKEWIKLRDAYMLRVLVKNTDLRKSGIVFMGAFHVANQPMQYPSSFGIDEMHVPLGTHLRRTIGPHRLISAWVQPALQPQHFRMVPGSKKELFWVRSNISRDNRCLYKTDSAEFTDAEKAVGADRVTGGSLPGGWDWFVDLK